MASVARPQPGTVLGGDFRVVRPLKEGGMGAVFVAEQISTGALRALKLMHPEHVENDAMRRRFEQEARAGARIQSDYVVHVIGAGVDDASGVPWIAMELLDGRDLGEHVAQKGALPPGEALEVMRMLCHALAAAHDVGIVHRDLKPENVFLARPRRTGEELTLKVLDFGIARVGVDVRSVGTAALGTPLWMAPEQTERGRKIGPHTDVWAIGLLAFYLLTGTWYWRAPHEESPSLAEFLRELTLEPLERASARAAVLGCAARVPDGFDEWFERCVARDPAARFPNARAAFAALEPLLRPTGGVALAATAPVAAPAPTRGGTVEVLQQTPFPVAPAAPPAAAGPVAPALSSPLAPGTAPGTSITRDAAASPPRRRGPLLATVSLLAAASAGLGAWAWLARERGGGAPTAHAAIAASSSAPASMPASSPPSLEAGAAAAAVKATARQVAAASPMVTLPGTVFPLGYAAGAIDERPVHDVSFPTFRIQIDEVTVAQYERCVDVGRCTPAGTEEFCNAGRPGREHNPINCVSYAQAEAYCAWLGRRLPTEDEWEYAASGKAKRLYAWGNGSPAGRVCWGRPDAGTCDVGSFDAGATPEGLRDMTGNVWEWTSSDYCPYDGGHCRHDQKVARGGGWYGAEPSVMRTQVRQGYSPSTESANVGFRCARSL